MANLFRPFVQNAVKDEWETEHQTDKEENREVRHVRPVKFLQTERTRVQSTGEAYEAQCEQMAIGLQVDGPLEHVEAFRNWDSCDLDDRLVKFARLGDGRTTEFRDLNPIQKQTIPCILQEQSWVLVSAPTGSGKTASFLLPSIQIAIDYHKQKHNTSPVVLILSVTRNLSMQTYQTALKFLGLKENENRKSELGVSVRPLFGGTSRLANYSREVKEDIVICCTGSLTQRIENDLIDLSCVQLLVLDEADKMVNETGFCSEILALVNKMSVQTRNALRVCLLSATVTSELFDNELVNELLQRPFLSGDKWKPGSTEPTIIQTTMPDDVIEHRTILIQEHLDVQGDNLFWLNGSWHLKLRTLMDVLDSDLKILKELMEVNKDGLFAFVSAIFTSTRKECLYVSSYLRLKGYNVLPVTSELTCDANQKVMNKLKSGEIQGIVTTNQFGRGADINNLSHVINFGIPTDFNEFVHRVGRTGRKGHKGRATHLVCSYSDRRIFPNLYLELMNRRQRVPRWLAEAAGPLMGDQINPLDQYADDRYKDEDECDD